MSTRNDWRQHFSANAGDLLQVQRVFAGEDVFKALLMACLKRARRTSSKINERTVLAVLSEQKEEGQQS